MCGRSNAVAVSLLLLTIAALAGCEGTDPIALSDASRLEAPGAGVAARASAMSPVVATFDKAFMPEEGPETLLVWHGRLTLDGVTGDLVSTIDLTDPRARWAGNTLHATVRWVVTGDLAIEFETDGVVNFRSEIVRTNGKVLSGPYAGSQVHQQGQLEGLDASGFLRIHPATGS